MNKVETRWDRAKIFEEFKNSSKVIFEKFKETDSKHRKFDDYYSLCICPKGRDGGINNRLFEVFYGNRIFDIETKIKSDFNVEKKHVLEHGTTLAFYLNDRGYVAIILHPSGTKYTNSEETAVFVENYVHPKKLQNKSFLRKYWRYLNSYMEYTSIDGCPSIEDKFRYYYLKYCKNLVINDKYQQTKIRSGFFNILKYTLTVGLSGFLIFLFTIFPNKNDKSIFIKANEQLNEMNINLEQIIKLQQETNMLLTDSIKNIRDSISNNKKLQ
jgi:hypothetical protein